MKYKSDKKPSKSFYAIIAICLAAVAVTSYITFAKKNVKNEKADENSVNSAQDDAYNDSSKEEISEQKAAETEKNATDVPYKETESKEVKTQEPKKEFVLPITGKIIKQYSDTALQYDETFGDMRLHKAIDISCNENDKVVAATSGTVTEVQNTADFLNVVTVDHGDGYTVKYCGLGTVSVKNGDTVGAGVLIGTAKNPPCECMDKCHIHIVCLKDGVEFDPIALYAKNK
ncbi:MAG: M23 family metallopeptidase [Clostridia bacterium]|nr:M23 family metallopeptidase [Clostridia bacterium]